MKNRLMAFAALAVGLVMGCDTTPKGAESLTLGDYSIELPATASGSQREAARELQLHLEKATGRKAAQNGSGVCFVLGRGPEGADKPEPFASLAERRGRTVYLWGDDAAQYPGTLYAVYGFLSERMGVVWAYPGEDGIAVPKRESVDFPEGTRDAFAPRYDKGVFRPMHTGGVTDFQQGIPAALRWTNDAAKAHVAAIERWHARHRLFSRANFTYGHAFTQWQTRFEKTHPEYLSLRDDGTRVGLKWQNPTTTKLCVSNPDVVGQILADWKASGTPKYLNVCENDGFNYCVCPKCKALDTDLPGEDFNLNKTDRYLWFWNRLAEKARQVRPDVQLVTYIYSSYRFPPRRERIEYPDNMCFGIVPTFTDDIRAFLADWAKAGLKRFFLRPNFHCAYSVLPRGVEKRIYDVYAYCRSHGLVGVDFDSDFGRYPLRPENYVTCRMIAEPEGSFEKFMDEFCSAYGEAKDDVAAYYAEIRRRYETRRDAVNAEARKGVMLDDTGMAKFQTRFHTEAELTDDVTRLEKAATRTFADPAAAKRTRDLVVFARHYLLTWRFMDAAGRNDAAQLAAVGKELLTYRVKHQDVMRDFYGMNMAGNWRGLENRIWKKIPGYPFEEELFRAAFWETPKKKVIASGWDLGYSTIDQVAEHADLFDKTGVDGVVFGVPYVFDEKGKRIILSTENGVMSSKHVNEQTYGRYVPVLKKLTSGHKAFKHSFLGCNWSPVWGIRLSWTNDAAWARFVGNMRVVASVAKRGGCVGLCADAEDYGSHGQYKLKSFEPPFDVTGPIARERGRQMGRAIFGEFPDAKILSYWFLSLEKSYAYSADPVGAMRANGDLWPMFINGLLDVMPPEAWLIDGDEHGYWYKTGFHDYERENVRMKTRALALIAPENRAKYRAQVQVGFGLYLDEYINPKKVSYRTKNGSAVEAFRDQLEEALYAADEYVWLYGEKQRYVAWKDLKSPYGRNDIRPETWEQKLPGLAKMFGEAKDPELEIRNRLAERKAAHATNLVAKVLLSKDANWQNEKKPQGTFTVQTGKGTDGGTAVKAENVGHGCFIFDADAPVRAGETYVAEAYLRGKGVEHFTVRFKKDNVWSWFTEGADAAFGAPDAKGWRRALLKVRVPRDMNGLTIKIDCHQQKGESAVLERVSLYKVD